LSINATFAPGIIPPLESATVPIMLPVGACAVAMAHNTKIAESFPFIRIPLFQRLTATALFS
jgi:hypothetical protein